MFSFSWHDTYRHVLCLILIHMRAHSIGRERIREYPYPQPDIVQTHSSLITTVICTSTIPWWDTVSTIIFYHVYRTPTTIHIGLKTGGATSPGITAGLGTRCWTGHIRLETRTHWKKIKATFCVLKGMRVSVVWFHPLIWVSSLFLL